MALKLSYSSPPSGRLTLARLMPNLRAAEAKKDDPRREAPVVFRSVRSRPLQMDLT